MIIKSTVKKKVCVDEIVDILCDICDKSCKHQISNSTSDFNFNYAKVENCFGYGSKLDAEISEEPECFYLCEQCYKEYILDNVITIKW